MCMNLSEALRPAPVARPQSYSAREGRGAAARWPALIRQEKERQAANEDDDIDDFWKDEKDDDEYSGSAESNTNGEMCSTLISTRTSPSLRASRCVGVFTSSNATRVHRGGRSGPRRGNDAPRRSEEEGWGFDDDQKEAKAREKRIEQRKKEKEKERVEREKHQPVGGKRRRRAAAENAEERTRQELEGDTTKDDSDDDFKDAAADKELSEGRLGVREQAAPSYKDAVSAAKREARGQGRC